MGRFIVIECFIAVLNRGEEGRDDVGDQEAVECRDGLDSESAGGPVERLLLVEGHFLDGRRGKESRVTHFFRACPASGWTNSLGRGAALGGIVAACGVEQCANQHGRLVDGLR